MHRHIYSWALYGISNTGSVTVAIYERDRYIFFFFCTLKTNRANQELPRCSNPFAKRHHFSKAEYNLVKNVYDGIHENFPGYTDG